MESLKLDKKNLMAPYQQSFRIDDLLTRKASEQQPGHFCPPLHPPPLGSTLHSPPPGMPGLEQMDKPVANLTCQANGKVTTLAIVALVK